MSCLPCYDIHCNIQFNESKGCGLESGQCKSFDDLASKSGMSEFEQLSRFHWKFKATHDVAAAFVVSRARKPAICFERRRSAQRSVLMSGHYRQDMTSERGAAEAADVSARHRPIR